MSAYGAAERRSPAFSESGMVVQPVHTGPQSFTLKCSGRRPMHFEGSELCMAMSYVPGAAFWYEVNIYRTVSDSFVVYIRMFSKSEDVPDLHRVFECGGFEGVVSLLEEYEAANDVRIDVLADDQSVPLPDLVVRAMGLRSRIEDARRQFGALVGQILFDLEV